MRDERRERWRAALGYMHGINPEPYIDAGMAVADAEQSVWLRASRNENARLREENAQLRDRAGSLGAWVHNLLGKEGRVPTEEEQRDPNWCWMHNKVCTPQDHSEEEQNK